MAAVEPFRKDRLLISFVIEFPPSVEIVQKNKAPPVIILSEETRWGFTARYLGGTVATIFQRPAALESAEVPSILR